MPKRPRSPATLCRPRPPARRSPDTWSESGDTYKLGKTGLIAWAGLIVVLLGVGINLVISTSSLGQ